MNRVFITAYSSVSALGINFWQIMEKMQLQKQLIKIPESTDKFHRPYFPIQDELGVSPEISRYSQLCIYLINQLKDFLRTQEKIPLFLATSTGGIKETEEHYLGIKHSQLKYPVFQKHFFDTVYSDLNDHFKDKFHDYYTCSTACSSSGHSLMQAYQYIKYGIINKAIVIGADVLCLTTMVGFDSLKLVSETGTKPMTNERNGLSLGEGGGALLLEAEPVDRSSVEIVGAATNSDAYHISSPDPEGTHQKKCMIDAIHNMQIATDEIDYINAHGTGTVMNDQIEMKVIQSLFPKGVAVTSTKSYIGHTLGASAVTEIGIVIEMLKRGKIFQLKDLGQSIDALYVPDNTVEKDVKYWMKNSFGFGGNNVSLVFKNLFH